MSKWVASLLALSAGGAALLSWLVCGALIGGFVGSRLTSGGMGIDRLADALGGLFLGALLGAIFGGVASVRLTPRARLVLAGLGCVGTILMVLLLRLIPPPGMELP